MDRRLVITTSLLILALAALMAGGLFGAAGAPAADQPHGHPSRRPATWARRHPRRLPATTQQ